jgi:hypothetical protein
MTGLPPTNHENPPHLNPLPSGERIKVRGKKLFSRYRRSEFLLIAFFSFFIYTAIFEFTI